MYKKLNKLGILLIIGFLVLTSCQKEVEPGGTVMEAMSGEWWVDFGVLEDGNLVADYGYYFVSTFNTADEATDKLWISDNNNFWQFQVKANANIEAMTFSVDAGTDLVWDDNTTIRNGKILEGAATSPSGVVTDSIYFEVEWASDPGTIYRGAGYRYTGWPEDDH